MNIRILIDVRVMGRGGASGIEEYTRELVTALLAADQKNEYILFANSFRRKNPLPEAWRTHPRVRIVNWHIPNKLLDAAVRFFGWPAIDRLIPADLVFSPHFTILKTSRAPRIITFHDLAFIHHPAFFGLRQRFWHWLQDYRRQAREATAIIAMSEFTKQDLVASFGIPEEKIHVVYSGVNGLMQPLPENDLALRAFQTAHHLVSPCILFLGTLEPRKNIAGVVRAFNLLKQAPRFKDVRLVVVGKRGWLYRDILRTIASSPYRSDIILWGAARNDERLFLYNSAKVFVYPSFFEGFGFPPLEAQACGTPAIVADRTSLAEVLGRSALRVNPWRVEELSRAISDVLTDVRLERKLKEEGVRNAARFRWQTAAENTLQILRRYAKDTD